MVRSGFSIRGLVSLRNWVQELIDQEVPRALSEALAEIGRWILERASELAPRDTGMLAESLKPGHSMNIWRVEWSRGAVQLIIGSDAEHAVPVEEGHWTNPQGVAIRWVPGYWVGDRFIYDPTSDTGMALKQQWIPGAHMFEIAFEQIEALAPGFVERKLQEVFDRAAKRIRA